MSWTCLVVRHALAAPMAEATTPAERCAALKLRAAGKKAKGKAACYAASVARHSDPNGCIARIEPRFSSAWARSVAAGGCAATDDDSTIEAKVDAFVGDLVAKLPSETNGEWLLAIVSTRSQGNAVYMLRWVMGEMARSRRQLT